MKQVIDILDHLGSNLISILGSKEKVFKKIVIDSRKAEPECLFIAIKGNKMDGNNYISDALEKGARVIIIEKGRKFNQNEIASMSSGEQVIITVQSSRKALATISSVFYDHPSKKLKLVGVTGTNGKTSIVTFLHQAMNDLGYKSGIISTIKIAFDGKEKEAKMTTPDVLDINCYLHEMVLSGVTHCFMEVTSQGIDQSRVFDLKFEGGIFTNLTQDHLDYHHDFKTYRDTKKQFFDGLPINAFAITNLDDKNGLFMLQNTSAKKTTCALRQYADYKAKVIEKSFTGTLIQIEEEEVWIKLIGNFNIINLLQVYACLRSLDIEKSEALKTVSNLDMVSGRFQVLNGKRLRGVIDYSHTPDSLKKIIESICEIKEKSAQLTIVFGCGGDRDKGKRPQMGQIASALADKIIITSDNPRTESPKQIIEDIFSGIDEAYKSKVAMIEDRKEAIKAACMMTEKGGIVLVSGKGHETYQIRNEETIFFSDRQVLEEALEI